MKEREIVWHKGDIHTERIALIVGVAVILISSIVAVAFYSELFGVSGNEWAKTDELVWKPTGTDWYVEGVNTDPVSGHQNELFTKMQYIGSWKRGTASHVSETIMIQGKIRGSGWSFSYYYPKEYWYVISWSDSLDGPWQVISGPEPDGTEEFVTMDNPGKINYPDNLIGSNEWNFLRDYWFEISGDYKNYIKVELKVYFEFIFGNLFPKTKTVTDICQMKSGIGELFIDGGTLFEIGEVVTFRMNTGISGTSVGELDKGWTLTIFDPHGDECKNWTIDDNKHGVTKTWTVPLDAFRTGDPTWNNIYRAVLCNSIIDYEAEVFMTIDDKTLAPSAPEITFSGGNHVGDQVIISLSSTPNIVTNSQIDKFVLYAMYGSGAYIIDGEEIYAQDNKAVRTIIPLHGGTDLIVKSVAIDSESRPSELAVASKHIYYPEDDEEDRTWLYILGGIIGIGAIGGVAYYATEKKKRPPYQPPLRQQQYRPPQLPPRY